jgi:hypothetical protein
MVAPQHAAVNAATTEFYNLLIITGTTILGFGYLIIEFLNNLEMNNRSTRIIISITKNQDLRFGGI